MVILIWHTAAFPLMVSGRICAGKKDSGIRAFSTPDKLRFVNEYSKLVIAVTEKWFISVGILTNDIQKYLSRYMRKWSRFTVVSLTSLNYHFSEPNFSHCIDGKRLDFLSGSGNSYQKNSLWATGWRRSWQCIMQWPLGNASCSDPFTTYQGRWHQSSYWRICRQLSDTLMWSSRRLRSCKWIRNFCNHKRRKKNGRNFSMYSGW